MKKIIVGAVLIVAIGGYVYWSSSQSSSTTPVATSDTPVPATTTDSNPQPVSSGSTGTSDSSNTGAFKDGTYTGAVADSIYGNIQVSATVSGGKLTDVKFLQYPNSQPHSVDVSNMSMPILKSEAIASQSAQVNIVSGATQTSEAFEQSLQSALSQAAVS